MQHHSMASAAAAAAPNKATIKACRTGNLQLLHAYLQAGGAPNRKINGGDDTLLIMASRHGHSSLCEALLEANADVEQANKVGHRAIHEAALWSGEMYKTGSGPASMAVLLAAGAQVDALRNAGWSALHLACTKPGSVEVVEQLLIAGASPTLRNVDGWHALHSAARTQGTAAAVRVLLAVDGGGGGGEGRERMANNITENGNTALMASALHGTMEVAEQLLASMTLPLDMQDSCGQTALHNAIAGGQPAMVRRLLEKGASVWLRDAVRS
jgi:ankyrin repeat protein